MPQPLFISVREFCQIFSIGQTKFYELRNAGEFEAVKIGSRTLVLVSSALSYAERLLDRENHGGKDGSCGADRTTCPRDRLCNTLSGGDESSGGHEKAANILLNLPEFSPPQLKDYSNVGGRCND